MRLFRDIDIYNKLEMDMDAGDEELGQFPGNKKLNSPYYKIMKRIPII